MSGMQVLQEHSPATTRIRATKANTMTGNPRRTFIGMSLTVASAGLVTAASAAGPREDAGPPTTGFVYLVTYRPGAKWIAGQPLRGQRLKEHFRYMLSLYQEGKLRHAGGFNDDSGGAAAFTAPDDAAANEIVAADPAVVSQVFTYELHRWNWVDWAQALERAAQPAPATR
jgi:uncharacterized protein YciI